MQMISADELNEMVRQAREGCADARGELLELYRSYLTLIARLHLDQKYRGKCSPSDVVQETYLQAARSFGDFLGNTEGELVAWLRRILASQLAMQIRRYATQRRDIRLEQQMIAQVDQSSLDVGDLLAARVDSPSNSAIRREHGVLLADALSQLPDAYQEVIVLRHLRGHRFPEVAHRMDRSLDSVKSLWRRAISRLRELLDDRMN